MALRLYRTTRPLFAQVVAALQSLGVLAAVGGNPTAFGLVALVIAAPVALSIGPRAEWILTPSPWADPDDAGR